MGIFKTFSKVQYNIFLDWIYKGFIRREFHKPLILEIMKRTKELQTQQFHDTLLQLWLMDFDKVQVPNLGELCIRNMNQTDILYILTRPEMFKKEHFDTACLCLESYNLQNNLLPTLKEKFKYKNDVKDFESFNLYNICESNGMFKKI